MAFTCRTGLHNIGIPGDATEPAPTGTGLTSTANMPAVGALRQRMIVGNDPFTSYATYLTEVIAAGFYPIPYLDTAFTSALTTATWEPVISHWATNLTAVGVETFEVGNEISPAEAPYYWSRLKEASPIIRAAGGRVLLSSAGGWGVGDPRHSTGMLDMLTAAHNAGVFPYVDGIAYHAYSGADGTPSTASGPYSPIWKIQQARALLDGWGGYAAELELWITEFGWATGPNPPDPNSDDWKIGTEHQQAQRLTSAYQNLLPDAQASNVRALVWFASRDFAVTPPARWPNFCGIRNPYPGLSHKESFAAMAAVGAGTVDPNVPTVVTGAATQDPTGVVTVNATVDPNSLSTRYYVQYGNSTGYGNAPVYSSVSPATGPLTGSTPQAVTRTFPGPVSGTLHYRIVGVNDAGTSFGAHQTLGLTSTPPGPVGISFPLSGQAAGSTVHYRLVGTNAQGTTYGNDMSFVLTAPPTGTAPELARINVLSTLLSVEVTTADGRHYRWDVDAADASNRPLSTTFATQAGDGFAEASCVVPRPINFDWPDLNLLDRIRFIGSDGSTAYEGRVAGIPRSVDADGERIEIQATGMMASARDRTFTDIYVDRSGDRWQQPTLQLRKANIAADNPLDADYSSTVDTGTIHFKGTTNKRIPADSQTILEYIMPTGSKVASFQYQGTQKNTFNEEDPTLYGTVDDSVNLASWGEIHALTLATVPAAGTPQSVSLDVPKPIIALRMRSKAVHGEGGSGGGTTPAPAAPAHFTYEKIAVYSDHGVELRPNGTDPAGVWASDVMVDIINRFCPQLDPSGIEQSTTVIAHLVFDTPTTPFDAFTLLNGFHLWNLGCWESGPDGRAKVVFAPADLTKADWQVRSDDKGVTLDLQGDTTDQFANGIVVSYTDIDQRATVLWPTDYEQLRDEDVDNPANRQGIELWTSLDISNPVDRKGALALGKAALEEFNRPKAPGTVTVNLGYLEDAQGNLQPGWKPRAGETLAITDLNESARLIIATSWNEEGTLQMTLEQPSSRIDAVLARLELSSQVAGL